MLSSHRLLLITAAAAVASAPSGAAAAMQAGAAAPAAAAAVAAVPILKRAQLDALLAAPDRVIFIDLRRADEISTIGGLPVFLSIQLPELQRSLAYIPRDRQIVTVSNHAGRAGKAAALLRAKGFNVVGSVGVENYAAEGGTLVGKKPVAAAATADSPAPRVRQAAR